MITKIPYEIIHSGYDKTHGHVEKSRKNKLYFYADVYDFVRDDFHNEARRILFILKRHFAPFRTRERIVQCLEHNTWDIEKKVNYIIDSIMLMRYVKDRKQIIEKVKNGFVPNSEEPKYTKEWELH